MGIMGIMKPWTKTKTDIYGHNGEFIPGLGRDPDLGMILFWPRFLFALPYCIFLRGVV